MCTTSYITGSKIGQNQRLMKRLMLIGLGLITISYGTLSFFSALIPFISILVVSSIGTGFVLPCVNSFITGAVGKERRGFVTSLYGSVRFLGVAIGPPIFGRLMEWSKFGMFMTIAGLTLFIGVLVLTMIHVKKEDKPKKGPKGLQPADAR